MSFSKKAFSLFQIDVVLFATSIITGAVIARELGPDLRGLYAIILLIPSYAEAFGRIKFDVASVYFLGKKIIALGEMLFILNLLAIFTSVTLIAIFLWQYDWIYLHLYRNTTVDAHLLTYTVLCLIPLQFISLNYIYIFVFQEDVKSYNLMLLLKALIGSFTGLVLLVLYDWGILGVLIGSISGLFFSIIYGFIKISRKEKMIPFFNFPVILEMIKYGSQHYIAGIIGHLQLHLTNLLSALYLLPSQVAFFSMAKGQGELLTRMVPNAVGTLLFSKISKSKNNRYKNNITVQSFRITFLIIAIISLFAILFIKSIVLVLYGGEYLPMIRPFLIILPGYILLQSTSVINSYFGGIGRPDLLPKISILPLIIQVAIAAILMPTLGIFGAALSFLISSVSLSIIKILVFCRLTKFNISSFLINRDDIDVLLQFIKEKLNTKGIIN